MKGNDAFAMKRVRALVARQTAEQRSIRTLFGKSLGKDARVIQMLDTLIAGQEQLLDYLAERFEMDREPITQRAPASGGKK